MKADSSAAAHDDDDDGDLPVAVSIRIGSLLLLEGRRRATFPLPSAATSSSITLYQLALRRSALRLKRRAAKGNSLNVCLSVFPPIRSTRPVRLLSAARRPGPANPAEHDEPTAQRTLSAGETPHPSDGALYNNSNNDDDDGGWSQVGRLAAEG